MIRDESHAVDGLSARQVRSLAGKLAEEEQAHAETREAARAARAHAEEALREVEADYVRCQDDVRALCRPAPPRPAPPGAAGQTNGSNFERSK